MKWSYGGGFGMYFIHDHNDRLIATVFGETALQAKPMADVVVKAPEMRDLLVKLRDTVEALDGTSVENEALVDEYRELMRSLNV